MTHASLFSGIGGFDLAAEWAGWENIFHCEWNPFGQKVLAHHFPNSKSYNDITKTDFTIHAGEIDVLTGGFPCQPYSVAGLRKGKADERHLFPEMLRAIKEIQPRYVVGENVRGLVSWGGGWFSTRCVLTWKAKVMQYNRLLFLLQASTHHTEEIGSGLLLTPTTREEVQDLQKFQERMQKYPNGTTMPNLATQVHTLLPTPTTRSDGGRATTIENGVIKNKSHTTGTNYGITLGQLAKAQMLPIPTTLFQNTNTSKQIKDGKSSQLSPLFVMEMMGYPTDWTTLPFLNGEKKLSKQEETQ